MKKLYKSSTDRKISGVCAGIAEYFNIDPTIVRIGWSILAVMAGSGVFAYIICMCVMPDGPGMIEE